MPGFSEAFPVVRETAVLCTLLLVCFTFSSFIYSHFCIGRMNETLQTFETEPRVEVRETGYYKDGTFAH